MSWRWGIAGPGSIATRFAEDLALVDDAVLAAVGSRSLERALAFAERFGAPTAHGSYEAMADDPAVDVVYISTPHAQHAALAELFLTAGKHVLCEKPLALNATEARRMQVVAAANNRFLMEAMWSRFLPGWMSTADVVRRGRIGQPRIVEAEFGFQMPVLPEHRLFDLRLGGGALLDIGVYPVHLCSLVLGTPDRVAADATIGSTGVDEQVAAVLHHQEGALGIVTAAIRTPMRGVARITGSEGYLDLPSPMHSPANISVTVGGVTDVIEAGFEGNGLRFQVEEVHRCLDDGRLSSDVLSMEESVTIADTLDRIRERIGLVYPAD